MSPGIVTKWPVVIHVAVEPGDRGDDNRLTEAAIDRIFATARAAYVDRCTTIADAATLTKRDGGTRTGDAPVNEDDGVTISVSVTEVFPDRFTMNALIRPAADTGIAATAWCSLSPASGTVDDAMRDEFIALAHAAEHYH